MADKNKVPLAIKGMDKEVPTEGEESVFEDAETETELPADLNESPDEEEEYKEFKPTISSESPKDKIERKGVKEEADGKIVTIKEWFFTRPKTKDKNGQPIAPKKTQKNQKEFFGGKLGIRYKDNNLVEYYPTMRYFVNDGKMSTFAKLQRVSPDPNKKSAVVKIVDLVVAKINKPTDEISDKEILDYLIDKKVKLKTAKGVYMGKNWFRNDIVEIL